MDNQSNQVPQQGQVQPAATQVPPVPTAQEIIPSPYPVTHSPKGGGGMKMMMIVLVLLILGGGGVFGYLFMTKEDKSDDEQETERKSEAPEEENDDPDPAKEDKDEKPSDVDPIGDAEVEPGDVVPIDRFELALGVHALELAVESGWDADSRTDITLTCSDLDQNLVSKYIEKQKVTNAVEYDIPTDLEDLFSNPEAVEELQAQVLTIYDEYVDYLEMKGVDEKYIKEFTTYTLPREEERLSYKGYDTGRWSFHEGYLDMETTERDFSRSQLRIYDTGTYVYAEEVVDSGIIGIEPATGTAEYFEYWTLARDVGLRYVMYHELTHALQVTYIHLNTPEDHFTNNSGYWQDATSLLSDAASQYFWDWGFDETFGSGDFNRVVGDESTAQGVAFEMLVYHYDLSDEQADTYWNFSFGGDLMSIVTEKVDAMKEIFSQSYPELHPSVFARTFENVIDTCTGEEQEFLQEYFVERMAGQRGIAQAVGYGYPLTLDEMDPFWSMLK